MKEFGKYVFYSAVSAVVFLLIYTIFFNPNVVVDTYENVKDFVSEKASGVEGAPNATKEVPVSTERLVPSEMEEYGYWKILHKSCAQIEALGESEGISNMKQKVCRESCGLRDMDYSSNDCEKDLLVCYCKT